MCVLKRLKRLWWYFESFILYLYCIRNYTILFVYKEIKYSSQRNFIKVIKTKNKKVISEMIH